MGTTVQQQLWSLLIGLSLLLILPLQGCVEDDLSVCGISVEYVYTKNVDYVDKFSTHVESITLFVYDSEGNYVGEYMSEGNRLHSGPMKLNLSEGRYSLVAWGNLCDDYTLTNKTRLDEAELSLVRTCDTISTRPGHLYHGGLYSIEVRPDYQNNQLFTIELTKNTNNIIVTTVGMPYSETGTSTTVYDCSIVSRNGDYKFDNNITGSDRLRYITESTINEDKEKVSDFIVMRELNDKNITDSKLIITRTKQGEAPVDIVTTDLTPILLPASITGDLDVDDEFEIEIEITETNGTTTILINGWDPLKGGGIV